MMITSFGVVGSTGFDFLWGAYFSGDLSGIVFVSTLFVERVARST